MKQYTVPYAYRRDAHWSAIDIHNDNAAEHVVTVRWFSHPQGKQTKEAQYPIPAGARFIVLPTEFPPAVDGRHIVKITGPDNLKVTHVTVGPWQMTTVEADA